jgi:hypothetical protein
MLSNASVGLGLGLGLFGILSIIRLRSDAITQEEIAYYFVALALGLLAGIAAGPIYLPPLLIGLLVLVMCVADHPRLLPRARRELVTLDTAIPDERLLRQHLESRLGIEVRHLMVQELDFVRDVTVVDVRYRVSTSPLLLAPQDDAPAGARLPHPVVPQAATADLLAPTVPPSSNGQHPVVPPSPNGHQPTAPEPL